MDETEHHDLEPEFVDAARLDPLAPPTWTDFPWSEVLGELGPANQRAEQLEQLAAALRVILRFVTESETVQPRTLRRVALKAVALQWVLSPESFGGGRPMSLSKLAKRLSVPDPTMSSYTTAFTRLFGVRNRFQSHGMNGQHGARIKPTA